MTVDSADYCCGLGSKKGTIIIGVIQSILTFISLVLCAAYVEHPHELISMSDPSIIPNISVLKTTLIVICVVNALHCIFSIMTIFGALSNRPLLLLPWLILNPIILSIYILGTLLGIIHHSLENQASYIIVHLLIGCVITLVGIYNIVVVRKHFKHLRSLNF